MRRSPLKSRPSSQPDADTVNLVIARASVDGMAYCEACGNLIYGERSEAWGWAIHHRAGRRTGDHRVVNLLLLCGDCHTHVHENPAFSFAAGFMVSRISRVDPGAIPVHIYGGRKYLTADGRYSDTPGGE